MSVTMVVMIYLSLSVTVYQMLALVVLGWMIDVLRTQNVVMVIIVVI